jgi:tRNA U34 5-carboxymethylaminomethyl modifying enzyme MnmG/GidA
LEDVADIRLGNSSRRVGLVSTRLTRLHNRVQHEPDPIINRVESLNPNTTRLPTELLEHDPGDPSESSKEEELKKLKKLRSNRPKKKKKDRLHLRLRLKKTSMKPIASKPWP